MRVVIIKHGAVVAQIIRRWCRVVAAAAGGGGCGETAHHLRPAHEEQEDRADEGIHRSFSSAPPPPPRPHVLLVGSSSSYHGLRAGDHSDLFDSIPESRWHEICRDVQRKGEREGYVGGGGAMANPRFKEHYLGLRVLSGNKCSSRVVHAPRAAYFMHDGCRHAPSRRSFSSSAASSPSGTPPTSPPTTTSSPPTTSSPAASTVPPAPAVSVPATTSPPASTATHAVSAPTPPSTSPDEQPMCSEATDRCLLLGDLLDTFYDPVEFVRHFPAVMFSHPMEAPDTSYDRWVFKGWFQYAVRDALRILHDHHLAGLEFEEISVKNMTITCNIDSSEFYPKFIFDGKIKKGSLEGQKRNYTQLGNALEQLISISAGATNVNAYHYQLLIDDAKDLLYKLKHPTLDKYEAYMLRNHPSLLQIEAHAAFYLTCYDQLKRLPKQPANTVFRKLPYAVGDRDGHWISIAQRHPLLSKQLKYVHDISNWSQAKYRRDGYSHRTDPGSLYSIVEMHRIYHQYFPRTLPDLMTGMLLMRQLEKIGLDKLFK